VIIDGQPISDTERLTLLREAYTHEECWIEYRAMDQSTLPALPQKATGPDYQASGAEVADEIEDECSPLLGFYRRLETGTRSGHADHETDVEAVA
jgi:hypothetical protein